MFIAFILGMIFGVCILAIFKVVIHKRHEWRFNSCARCGQPLDDWGPPRAGEPPATL